MHIRFIGDPMEKALDLPPSRNSIDWYGVNFRIGEVVDVSCLTDVQQRVLARNSHFEVVEPAPAEAAPRATKKAAAET